MGAGKRLVKFGAGGVLGAAVGALGAMFSAPQSGRDLQTKITDRMQRARQDGAVAQAAKEQELIQKYRAGVNNPGALKDEEAQATLEAAQTISAVGLGLNAPGALAAQETALRATDAPARSSGS